MSEDGLRVPANLRLDLDNDDFSNFPDLENYYQSGSLKLLSEQIASRLSSFFIPFYLLYHNLRIDCSLN